MDYQFNGNDLKMKTGGLWKRLAALQVAKLEVENNFVYTSVNKIYLFYIHTCDRYHITSFNPS